ncbi:MAG TPA: hypothetical protein PLC61_08930 [Chitinophagales bacterium]|nr:hypothetical protein [Chitinophagales bacterium]MCB0512062.1 hypothetical protein [Bacteroidota bacterium]MCB9074844.1 hypothetical protein [Chitinophagales bacterium]HMU97141.1 hypothetical protein [Chitinophagales bacterium]HMV02499.1 hypothetical protein [Chitinophagales bacterium]
MEIKINHTNSLSAARYFSSFGIQNFGFTLDSMNPNHISLLDAKQIVSWLYQPNIILEVGIFQNIEEIEILQKEFHFSSVELNIHHPDFKRIIEQYNQSWIKLNIDELQQIDFNEPIFQDSAFIINIFELKIDFKMLIEFSQKHLILIDLNDSSKIEDFIKKTGIMNYTIPCVREKSVGKLDLEPYEHFLPYLEDAY